MQKKSFNLLEKEQRNLANGVLRKLQSIMKDQ